ncbi:MAG: MFS transporter [Cyanobacteria bacterium]|nr:MFS transporter [Cyanobacteriota bacterium]
MTSPAVRYTPPWIFGITNIPFGVAGTYSGVAMPFILRKYGIPLDTIAGVAALSFLPAAYQLFWAPIIDLGMRRRNWLILCSCLGAACLSATLFFKLPEQLLEYEIVMVIGQALVGLVSSCNGALVSTTVDPAKRGQAAGWVNAANLGAAALGGGVVLTLFNSVSSQAAAVALLFMIILPSIAALWIDEAPPIKEPLFKHLGNMGREVWRAVKARRGWTGLLFCLSPVGTVALTNLFSGLGSDYHVSNQLVEWINGYGGGFVTALGCLVSGYMLDRFDRRKAYLLAGLLTAVCCSFMAFAPHRSESFIAGTLAYLLISGLAYAAFSAVVYEIVGTAGSTASTLYSVFPAAGNQAIAYTLLIDGKAHKMWGTRGLFLCDAALNLIGVALLFLMLRIVFPDKGGKATELEDEGIPQTRLETDASTATMREDGGATVSIAEPDNSLPSTKPASTDAEPPPDSKQESASAPVNQAVIDTADLPKLSRSEPSAKPVEFEAKHKPANAPDENESEHRDS